MANIIDTTKVIDPGHLQPFTAPSLQFLQDSVLTNVLEAVKAYVGPSYSINTPYCLSGLNYTGTTALPTAVNPGAILYQGEIYGVNSGFGPAATGAVFTLVITQGSPDPLTFSDNVTENVHNIRKFQIVDATPGSGLFDLTDVVYIGANFQKTQASPAGPFSTGSAALTPIPGATFTTTGTKKYKVTISGDITVVTSGSIEGGTVTIENQTTSAILAAQTFSFTTSIGTVKVPFNVQAITSALPSGTVLIANAQRVASNNVAVDNMKWIVEEF